MNAAKEEMLIEYLKYQTKSIKMIPFDYLFIFFV